MADIASKFNISESDQSQIDRIIDAYYSTSNFSQIEKLIAMSIPVLTAVHYLYAGYKCGRKSEAHNIRLKLNERIKWLNFN